MLLTYDVYNATDAKYNQKSWIYDVRLFMSNEWDALGDMRCNHLRAYPTTFPMKDGLVSDPSSVWLDWSIKLTSRFALAILQFLSYLTFIMLDKDPWSRIFVHTWIAIVITNSYPSFKMPNKERKLCWIIEDESSIRSRLVCRF